MPCTSCSSSKSHKSSSYTPYVYGGKTHSKCSSCKVLLSGRCAKEVCIRFDKDIYKDPRTGAKYIVQSMSVDGGWDDDTLPDTVPVFVLLEEHECDECSCKDCDDILSPPATRETTCAYLLPPPQ